MIHPNSFTVKSVHRHWMLCAHGLRCEAHGSFMDAFDDRNASRLCWLTNFWAICWPQIVKTICFPKKVTKNLFLMAGDYEWTEWSLQEERLDSKFWQIGKFRNHQQVQEFLKIETFSVFFSFRRAGYQWTLMTESFEKKDKFFNRFWTLKLSNLKVSMRFGVQSVLYQFEIIKSRG